MLPVAMNVPALGMNSSALWRYRFADPSPPATSTVPLPRRVAVWYCLDTVMLPVAVKPSGGTVTVTCADTESFNVNV